MNAAKENNVTVRLAGEIIRDTEQLAEVIMKRRFEKSKREELKPLDLFLKALMVVNAAARTGKAQNYTYDLDWSVFLYTNLAETARNRKKIPPEIKEFTLLTKAADFLAEKNDHFALEMLWEMNSVKRINKETQKDKEALVHIGKNKEEVKELIPSLFSKAIKSAYDSKVQLKFGQTDIQKAEDLAGEIEKKDLSLNGRTYRLFEKCLQVVSIVARENAGLPLGFHFDLLMLTPDNLKRKDVQDNEIESIIDTRHDRMVIDFLQSVHALSIRFRSLRPEDNGATISSPQDLLYPKRS